MDCNSVLSCRVCLKSCNQNCKNVKDIADIFQALTGYQFHSSDPQKVCNNCYQQFVTVRKLKEKCDATEEHLKIKRTEEVKEELIPKVEFLEVLIKADDEDELDSSSSQEQNTESIEAKIPRKTVSPFSTAEMFVKNYRTRKPKPLPPPSTDPNLYEANETYVCDGCNKTFYVFQSLLLHVKLCMKSCKTIPCSKKDCPAQLFSTNMLKYHLEATKCGPIGFKNAYTCTYCNAVFTLETRFLDMKNHLSDVRNNCSAKKSFKCTCDKLFNSLDELRTHCAVNECSDRPLFRKLQCNYCDFMCCIGANIRFHMKAVHSNISPGICSCGHEYYCDDLYLQHILYSCGLTSDHVKKSFDFMLGSTLNESKKISPKEVKVEVPKKQLRIMCELCGKELSFFRLPQHMSIVHATPENRVRYHCDICKASYNEKENLRRHIISKHIRPDRYPCKGCDRVFNTWGARYSHNKKIHTKEFDYVCDFCGMRFIKRCSLVYHMSSHSEERNHQCPECHKRFKSVMSLGYHKKNVHHDATYSCPICEKKFKSLHTLKQHRSVHQPNQYVCPVCSLSFSVSHSLRGHVAKIHPDYPMPPIGTKLRNVDINLYNRIDPSQLKYLNGNNESSL